MDSAIFFSGEDTRKSEIVATCLRIVDQSGLKGLTVARIARDVGFVESALYRHFRSKRDILALILDETLKVAENQIREVGKKAGDGGQELRLMLDLHLDFLELYPGIFRIVYSDEIHMGEPELLDKLGALTEFLTASLEKIFRRGMRDGHFRRNLDPALAAIHFMGIIQVAFSFWTIKKRGPSLRDIGRGLMAQLMAGISVSTPS